MNQQLEVGVKAQEKECRGNATEWHETQRLIHQKKKKKETSNKKHLTAVKMLHCISWSSFL